MRMNEYLALGPRDHNSKEFSTPWGSPTVTLQFPVSAFSNSNASTLKFQSYESPQRPNLGLN